MTESLVEKPRESTKEKQPKKAVIAARFVPAVVLLSAFASACAAKESQEPEKPVATPTIPPLVTETIPAGFPTSFAESSPTQQVIEPIQTPEVQLSVFNQLRQKINAFPEGADKDEVLAIVDKFEKADQVLTEFKAAYDFFREPDGTPTLLAQERSIFENLDLEQLWEGNFSNQDEFLENQIPFMHDKRILNQTVAILGGSTDLTLGEIKESLIQKSSEFLVPLDIYLQVNSRPQNSSEIITSFNADTQIQAQIQKKSTHIKAILDRLPIIGDLKIQIEKDVRGGIFNWKPYALIKIGLSTPDETLIHEFAHSLDPENNPLLLRSFTPQEFVRLMIARNKAILDPKWGRTYNSWQKIYSNFRFFDLTPEAEKQPMRPEEFAYASSFEPNTIWIKPTLEKGTPFTESIFSKYLSSPIVEQLIADNQVKYKSLQEFLEKETANLDRVSSENKYLDEVIKIVKENYQVFSLHFGPTDQQPIPGYLGIPAGTYWQVIRNDFGPLILAQGLLENDEEIKNLFPSEDLKQITDEIRILIFVINREQFANGIQKTISPPSVGLSQPDNNPYQNFLDLVRGIKEN